MKLVIVTGLSGSGKSIALNALEDLDYYCIDNLPVDLLPAFAAHLKSPAHQAYENAAVGIDARNLAVDFCQFPEMLESIRQRGLEVQIFYLDADDPTLIKRFSETRRKHPLSRPDLPLTEAITLERRLLEPMAIKADWHIDTSRTTIHQLGALIAERLGVPTRGVSLLLVSFGYKHGLPGDADFVFDARGLPNPHWETHLRPYSGLDAPIAEFLSVAPLVEDFYQDVSRLLDRWVPRFDAEHRAYLTVAIGCTGGQHRSVYLVERLATHFREQRAHVLTRHRELK